MGSTEKPAVAFPALVAKIPAGLVWQYRIVLRDGHENHEWGLTGDRGGIHVSASARPLGDYWRENWMGGVEGHSPIKREYDSEKPSHDHCWLIHGPCWHDGSSLQFSEQIAPYLPEPGAVMGEREHLEVLRILVDRYESWLPTADEIEAARRDQSTETER